MLRLTTIALAAVFVVSACASDGEVSPPDPTTTTTTDAEPTLRDDEPIVPSDTEASPRRDEAPVERHAPSQVAPTTDPPPPVDETVTEQDLVLFIAAAERALVGTAQESAIYDDPEIYIALGQISCDRFSEGADFDEVAVQLLADMESDQLLDEPRLVGAVIGAATQTLCPEHADVI